MTLSYLSDDIFGQEVLPAAWQGNLDTDQDPSDGGKYWTTNPGGSVGGIYGQMYDETAEQPTFDNAAGTYTPQAETGDSVEVNNVNGLNPSATVTLSYSAQTGATTTHTSTKAITAGTTESVNVSFPGIGGSNTTFSLSGTFSYTNGTSTSKATTVTSTVQQPVTVPAGRIYQAVIDYQQDVARVPYTLQVYVPDTNPQDPSSENVVSSANFDKPVDGNQSWGAAPSQVFGWIQQYGAAGDESVLYSSGTSPQGYTAGVVTLNGTATLYNFSNAQTEVYDVTSQTGSSAAEDLANGATPVATTPIATMAIATPIATTAMSGTDQSGSTTVSNESVGVGVHRILGDDGESYVGSPFDDWIEGGAGNDHIDLGTGGNDRASGGDGDDVIQALGGGRSVLEGDDGNDHLTVVSDQAHNELSGGAGNDLIEAYAPQSLLTGGSGDDTFVLDGRSLGSIILDADGNDKLQFAPTGPIALERSGENLLIHTTDSMGSFNPTTDIAWLNFFSGDGEVNGLCKADLESLIGKGATAVYSPDTGTWSAAIGTAALASIFDKTGVPVCPPDTNGTT